MAGGIAHEINTPTQNVGGTIHRHGGMIAVDSGPEMGASFTIRLPRVAPGPTCRPLSPPPPGGH